MRNPVQPILFLVVFVTLAVIALLAIYKIEPDIDGEEANVRTYCKMVHAGYWPDFKERYKQFCVDGQWNGR